MARKRALLLVTAQLVWLVMAGIHGVPSWSIRMAAKADWPCLRAVDRYERNWQNAWAPAMVRRHPATFIRIFRGRTSCSEPLFVNGTRRSSP